MATFCQCYVSTGNSVAANSDNGSTWGFTLPASVGIGNCLILKVSYPIAGVVSTISDTVNGSWSTTPVKSVTGAVMKLDTYIFPNSAAGKNIVTIVFTAALQPVVATVIEWSGLATASPANGSSGTATVAATALSCGSFTPGANTGGNLILAFFDIDATSASGGNPTSFTAGTSFTLNDANIAWNQGQGLPNASEFFEQVTPAAINPGMTTAGDTNNYNCVAIALKESSGSGTAPAAFRVAKFFEFTNANQASTSMPMQIPTVGNCLVVMCTQAQTAFNFNSTTDNQSATYTQETPQTDGCQAWFKANATPSPTLVVTAHFAAIPNQGVSMFAWDIVGALASPLGTVASTAGAILGPGSIAHLPDITPVSTNSIIIAGLNVGSGPTSALTSPSGAYYDCPIYPFTTPPAGHTDSSTMDFGDGQGHYYNSDLTTKNFTWTDAFTSSSTIGSLAIEIKGPVGIIENKGDFLSRSYPQQWYLSGRLLFNAAQDFSSSTPETNTHLIPRAWPLQWNIDRRLFQTRMSGPEFSFGIETNQHYKPQSFPLLWFLTQWQRTNDSTFIAAVSTPTYVVPRAFALQWNVDRSLFQRTAQDLSSLGVETNVNYLPRTWPFQWTVQQSLMRGAPQDFSSTVVVTGSHVLSPMGARLIYPIGI